MSANGVVGVILASVVLAVPSARYAQPLKVYVEGGPKDIKQQVVARVAASTDMVPVPYAKQPEANIDLQKSGGAKVKCGSAKAFMPGPTPELIVAQFRAWLPEPLAKRRTGHIARAEAWSRALDALAAGAVATANNSAN